VCLAALASLLAGSLPPVVLSLVREREPAAIPWAWALHAAAATLAVALAGVASPLAALAAGAACCLAAALLMRWVEANRASN
jgi:hypothetical protein